MAFLGRIPSLKESRFFTLPFFLSSRKCSEFLRKFTAPLFSALEKDNRARNLIVLTLHKRGSVQANFRNFYSPNNLISFLLAGDRSQWHWGNLGIQKNLTVLTAKIQWPTLGLQRRREPCIVSCAMRNSLLLNVGDAKGRSSE